jgi:hypothetical protein
MILHNLMRIEDSASDDHVPGSQYPEHFKEITEKDYLPQQILNMIRKAEIEAWDGGCHCTKQRGVQGHARITSFFTKSLVSPSVTARHSYDMCSLTTFGQEQLFQYSIIQTSYNVLYHASCVFGTPDPILPIQSSTLYIVVLQFAGFSRNVTPVIGDSFLYTATLKKHFLFG